MISNPIQTSSALLIWQSPLSGVGSRRRLPVAVLRNVPGSNEVSFRYLTGEDSFATAREEGFEGYTGIPLDREDTSDAIHTLGRRLPNPDRPDYDEFLVRFGLRREHNLSTLSLLAYTGAKLTGDSFSVSDTFEGYDRPFQFVFDVAGRRHYLDRTPNPEIGEEVFFSADPTNEHDPHAVEMTDKSGQRFGFVNTCQAPAVSSWLQNGSITGRVFRVNGRVNYPRLFVLADVDPSRRSEAA